MTTTSVKVSLPAGAPLSRSLYPGAILDPEHTAIGGAGGKIWLASGWIKGITALAAEQTNNAVIITVLDARDVNGRPVASTVAPFERYVVDDATATAEKPGIGVPSVPNWAPGVLIYDVFGGAKPAAVSSNWLQWEGVAVEDDGTNGRLKAFHWPLPPEGIYCGAGMMLRAVSLANPVSALSLAVTYEVDISGATRYGLAQNPSGSRLPV